MKPLPLLGEQLTPIRSYFNGKLPIPSPPAVLVGARQCIEAGDMFPLPAMVRTLPAGVDSRCWTSQGLVAPVYRVSGTVYVGLLTSGKAFVLPEPLLLARVGLVHSGLAYVSPIFPLLARVGLVESAAPAPRIGIAPSVLAGFRFSAVSRVGIGVKASPLAGMVHSALATHTP